MVHILPNKAELAQAAARHAAQSLRSLLQRQQTVRLLAATGNSQLEFLDRLALEPDLRWSSVHLFHLDEYVGLSIEHPASFARYIKQRIIDRFGIERYFLLNGIGDPQAIAAAAGTAISSAPVDLAFCGIGENGHLAFNDPPADFDTQDPYLVVDLNDLCRRQQVGEGWFATLDDVPKQALSVSINQLLKTREIVCLVPDLRKAAAVQACLEGTVSPLAPASVLRVHPHAAIYLDADSASLLRPKLEGSE